jgi:hypothetical protein
MWRKYFIVVKVVPGRIKTPRHGLIDLSSDNLSIETLKELYEEDWPYIEITAAGRNFLYGTPQPVPEQQPAPEPDEAPLEEPEPDIEPEPEIPAASPKKPRTRATKPK